VGIASIQMKSSAKTRVLAINFGGIGDEVLFLPTLATIKKSIKSCHLTLLLEPRSRSIEQITTLVDRTITFDIKKRPLYIADLLKLVATIRDGGYDIVISSGGSKQVSVLLFLGGAPIRIGYDSGPLSHRLLTSAVSLNKDQYAAAMYHDLATALPGVSATPADGCIPTVEVPSGSMNRMGEFLERTASSAATKRVLLHPGTSRLAVEKGIIKTWKADHWVQLIRFLGAEGGVEIFLAGGPDDEAIISAIMKEAPKNAPLRNCYGVTESLADLAALIRLTDLLVCVDSAPMHIGIGLRKRLVAMFGPTDEKKLVPNDPRFKTLRGGGTTPAATLQPPPQDELGVQLQPGIVFQSVMDQLKAESSQRNSLELSR
jgi:ADP-heptose:LPS heptosyltransferase